MVCIIRNFQPLSLSVYYFDSVQGYPLYVAYGSTSALVKGEVGCSNVHYTSELVGECHPDSRY